MGSVNCCQVAEDDVDFKIYCKEFSSQNYKQYLQSIQELPSIAYEEKQQIVLGDWQKDSQTRTGKGIIYCSSAFYYEGDIVQAKASGKGKIVLPKKVIYQGETQNNAAKGEGQLRFLQDQIVVKGQWNKGLPVINSRMELQIKTKKSFITFSRMSQESDQFVESDHYEVKIQFENGSIYQGQIGRHQDTYKITGKGRLNFADGSYYVGDFVNGKMHGFGTYFWSKTGHWFEGEYKQNLREGAGTYYYSQNKTKQGRWIAGVFQKQVHQIKEVKQSNND